MGLKQGSEKAGFYLLHFSNSVTLGKLISPLIPSFLISNMKITIPPSQGGGKAQVKKHLEL